METHSRRLLQMWKNINGRIEQRGNPIGEGKIIGVN